MICAVLPWVLGACTVQLASHATKRVMDRNKTGTAAQGVYKVGLPYQINGVTYRPAVDYRYTEIGIASWYGREFHGKRTANGAVFNMNEVSAAHRTLPIPSIVRVTNMENGRSLVVRITDRGPFARGRIIDMSRKAAQILGFRGKGTARVRVDILAQESRALAEEAKRNGRVGEDPVTVASLGQDIAIGHAGSDSTAAAWRNPDSVDRDRTPIQTAATERAVMVEDLPPLADGLNGGLNGRKEIHRTEKMRTEKLKKPSNVVAVYQPDNSKLLFVQAGAFRSYDNAERLRAKLGSVAPAAINRLDRGRDRLYRVRLGPLNSISEADRVLESLVSKGHGNATIVVEDSKIRR